MKAASLVKDKVTAFNAAKTKMPEVIALVVFAAALVTVMAFHEPWFDEAEAWEIAKDASLYDILFTEPHYEGHPALWWLILAIPAKLGVPFEIGLKTLGAVLSTGAAALLLFKTRLPRIAKIFIPFTYFFFYQYGVIVRPYSLTLIAWILAGILFKTRNEHPWRFVLTLMLSCATSAYGMLLAGGVAIAWVADIFPALFKEKRNPFRDRRFLPLLTLLLFAALLVLEIFPYEDTYQGGTYGTTSKLLCMVTAVFTMLGDVLVTSSPWFTGDRTLLQGCDIEAGFLIPLVIVNLILWLFVIAYSSKKNLKYLLVPYLLFTGFAGLVYFSDHHIGIAGILLLFFLVLNTEDEEKWGIGNAVLCRMKDEEREKNRRAFSAAAVLLALASVIIPIGWCVSSSIMEFQYSYYSGKDIGAFIREYNLQELNVAGQWFEPSDTGQDADAETQYLTMNTVLSDFPALVVYFDENFIYNFNNGRKDQGYTLYMVPSAGTNEENLALWRTHEIPDVLIGELDVSYLTGGLVTEDDYAAVFVGESNFIWKGSRTHGQRAVYLRRDLLTQYGLTEIEVERFVLDNKLYVSRDYFERVKNGENVEDVVEDLVNEQLKDFGKDTD